MKTDISITEAMQRASERLKEKMSYSIGLLRKAEPIATAYDRRGDITSPSAEEKTARPCSIWRSWPAYSLKHT